MSGVADLRLVSGADGRDIHQGRVPNSMFPGQPFGCTQALLATIDARGSGVSEDAVRRVAAGLCFPDTISFMRGDPAQRRLGRSSLNKAFVVVAEARSVSRLMLGRMGAVEAVLSGQEIAVAIATIVVVARHNGEDSNQLGQRALIVSRKLRRAS